MFLLVGKFEEPETHFTKYLRTCLKAYYLKSGVLMPKSIINYEFSIQQLLIRFK